MAEHLKQDHNGHGSRPRSRVEKTMEGVSDELIFEMAETIGDNQNLPKLALKLGFKNAGADRFFKMNRMFGVVSSAGTREMLCTWRKSTPAIKQWVTLEEALIKADLAGIADEFSSMAEGKARNVPSFPMEIPSRPVSGVIDLDGFTKVLISLPPFPSWKALHLQMHEELQRHYTDPARFAEDTELLNQGFIPQLKRRESSSAPFYALENSRHDILNSQMRRLTVSSSNTAELTTLCHSLSYDWATENGATALSEMQHLFELSANGIKPNQTIEKAIKDQLFPDLDEVDEALIRQLLNGMPDEIAILIDGANESNCGKNIMDVLTGRTHQKVTVIVTTKPRFANTLHLNTQGGYDRIYMD